MQKIFIAHYCKFSQIATRYKISKAKFFITLVLGMIILVQASSAQSPDRDAAIELAETGVSSNAEWTPYSEEINGVEMVLVPKGCFIMGSTDEQIDYAVSLGTHPSNVSEEQPAHEQCFDEPFWIDLYEVTNAQFRQFNGQAKYEGSWTRDNLPRETISWYEAWDFCESRGSRLPTEREWEYAARGVDSLIFPWGNEFVSENVIYRGNSDEIARVGSRPSGASWVGALDMSGNVWEWVNTILHEYPYSDSFESNSDDNRTHIKRGGYWAEREVEELRAATRLWQSPERVDPYTGMRCARDYEG